MNRLFLCLIVAVLVAGCAGVSVPAATIAPEPTPRLPPPIPPLPPPTFNACQPEPNPDAAPNHPVLIAAIDKDAETVTLKNVSPDPVDLTGWHMCSIREHQEHPISGSLASGEQKDVGRSTGSIWSNDDTNDGALYNAEGQLVSYWHDPQR
jgi:hypothetical protein